jgi:LDH2 family malate/lactate/ureidoglycolate dehydrogenase
VRIPGERSAQIVAERSRDGIPVEPELFQAIGDWAAKRDVRLTW